MARLQFHLRPAVLVAAAILGIAALTGSAVTQTAVQQNNLRAQCRDDFISHCSEVSPGGKEALACLQEHVATLSSACKPVVMETLPAKSPAATTAPTDAQQAPDSQPLFAPGAAIIAKACARTLLLSCRGQFGEGRGVACLRALRDRGHFIGIRCDAALALQSKL